LSKGFGRDGALMRFAPPRTIYGALPDFARSLTFAYNFAFK